MAEAWPLTTLPLAKCPTCADLSAELDVDPGPDSFLCWCRFCGAYYEARIDENGDLHSTPAGSWWPHRLELGPAYAFTQTEAGIVETARVFGISVSKWIVLDRAIARA